MAHNWTADGWMEFLDARAVCVRSMVDQGCTWEEIVKQLSLQDASHAERIFYATNNSDHPSAGGGRKHITHRCDSEKSEDGGSCSRRVACDGARWSDGTMTGGCAEPCFWVMGKTGYGTPPWTPDAEGHRCDPWQPDPPACGETETPE